MKKVELNDLPKYTNWISRLLGIEPFEKKVKSQKELEREYEGEKWGPLLERIKNNHAAGLEEIDKWNYVNDERCVWLKDGLYLMPVYEVYNAYINLVCETILPYIDKVSAVVELGSGYGNISLNLAKRLKLTDVPIFMGELSKSGVEASKIIAEREGIAIRAEQCNFFDLDLSTFDVPADSLIFTSFALVSIPSVPNDFCDRLLSVNPKYLVLFEPCKELYDPNTLIGLMRRRYIDINDYNQKIYTYFTQLNKLSLISIQESVIGINPLLPVSVLVFKVES